MENLNVLPSMSPKTDDQTKVLLRNMLYQNPNETQLNIQSQPQQTQIMEPFKVQKASVKTRLKRAWILILMIAVLYLIFSMRIIDTLLANKFNIKKPTQIGISKVILFTTLIILIFMLPVAT